MTRSRTNGCITINPLQISINARRFPLTVFCYFTGAQISPCSISNGKCSHLCLLSSVCLSGYSCSCPEGMLLSADQHTCFNATVPLLSTPIKGVCVWVGGGGGGGD